MALNNSTVDEMVSGAPRWTIEITGINEDRNSIPGSFTSQTTSPSIMERDPNSIVKTLHATSVHLLEDEIVLV